MRLTVVYDTQGNIAALAASPPDSAVAYLETKPGERTIEIDAPEMQVDLGIQEIRVRMNDIIQNYRIEIVALKAGSREKQLQVRPESQNVRES
jgi:hypothetical protein